MSYNWVVSLNDGRRYSMNDLTTPEGRNPMDSLVDILGHNSSLNGDKVKITSVEAIVNNVRYNGPSFGKNSIYKSNENVNRFFVFWKMSADIFTGGSAEKYMGISWRLSDYRVFQWINLNNNSSYLQVLNVINPITQEEKDFQVNEGVIESLYSKTNGS
jgi:hypothetical protein